MPKAKEIFVDTGAWVVLAVEDDAHHRAAGLAPAISFLEMLEVSPRIQKAYSTPELEEVAYQILKRHRDQDFSFTDAVSFALMRKAKIEKAFAFDRHFRTLGFFLVP